MTIIVGEMRSRRSGDKGEEDEGGGRKFKEEGGNI